MPVTLIINETFQCQTLACLLNVKWKDLLVSLLFMMVNDQALDSGLLVGEMSLCASHILRQHSLDIHVSSIQYSGQVMCRDEVPLRAPELCVYNPVHITHAFTHKHRG